MDLRQKIPWRAVSVGRPSTSVPYSPCLKLSLFVSALKSVRLQCLRRWGKLPSNITIPVFYTIGSFPASYQHKHRPPTQCLTCTNPYKSCEHSRQIHCDSLGCSNANLVKRKRLEAAREDAQDGKICQAPVLLVGRIGSGDSVMKSAKDRDQIAATHGLVAFEMEGAGIWDEIPCIIIKSICDYADSHKNKQWQDYAAATAASAMKAVLELYPRTDRTVGKLGPWSSCYSEVNTYLSSAHKTSFPCPIWPE